MICAKCGVENSEHAKFCYECGNALKNKTKNDSSTSMPHTETNKHIITHEKKHVTRMEPTKFTVNIPVVEEKSGRSRATATLLFGFVGFAATSGKIRRKQLDAYVSTHEKGIRINLRKKYRKDVRIEWDKIVHVKLRGLFPKEIKMYLINEDFIIFRFGPSNELYSIIKENMCGVIPENIAEEGWD